MKGYIRKGKIHQGLKQFSKAQDAYQKAIDIDPNCQDALDGFRECMMAVNSDPEEVSLSHLESHSAVCDLQWLWIILYSCHSRDDRDFLFQSWLPRPFCKMFHYCIWIDTLTGEEESYGRPWGATDLEGSSHAHDSWTDANWSTSPSRVSLFAIFTHGVPSSYIY